VSFAVDAIVEEQATAKALKALAWLMAEQPHLQSRVVHSGALPMLKTIAQARFLNYIFVMTFQLQLELSFADEWIGAFPHFAHKETADRSACGHPGASSRGLQDSHSGQGRLAILEAVVGGDVARGRKSVRQKMLLALRQGSGEPQCRGGERGRELPTVYIRVT
jgi:hypothetical protein